MPDMRHQYIDRATGAVCDEPLYQDRLVRMLYCPVRERLPTVFRALTSRRATQFFGALNYDMPLGSRLGGAKFLRRMGIDLSECLAPPQTLNTARKVFERQIRYWECRPEPCEPQVVVSPADSRVLVGSFAETSRLFLKEKFFSFAELLGDRACWSSQLAGGDFAIFRLTPEKYHYTHTPVAGEVLDFYEVEGVYHSCNPAAVVTLATPYSKNRRAVTIIDTDVPGGTGVGLVAVIEVVALMIGQVVQCYSSDRYESPAAMRPGMFLERGQPKSLFRPGSSTVVLIFQPDRVRFAADVLANLHRPAMSRFSQGFLKPLVETDVPVRSWMAARRGLIHETEPGSTQFENLLQENRL